MVVDDFNVECIPRAPAKTESPLLVHADAVLPLPVTFKLFQSVSRRDPQILKDGCGVQYSEFPKRNSMDTRPELPDGFTPKKAFRVSILEALDHNVS